MQSRIISKTEAFVRDYLRGVESGHNWWHISRVRNTAMLILSQEKNADPFITEMGALLHDIDDHKIREHRDGEKMLEHYLNSLDLNNIIKKRIIHIVKHVSFRDSFNGPYKQSRELNIVQDADRLDAMGAIGIARAFNYGGSKGLEIYIPGTKPRSYNSTGEYISSESSTINHFYEKLLKLKDMMNTATGRNMAEERHNYMEVFLQQFYNEWGGN